MEIFTNQLVIPQEKMLIRIYQNVAARPVQISYLETGCSVTPLGTGILILKPGKFWYDRIIKMSYNIQSGTNSPTLLIKILVGHWKDMKICTIQIIWPVTILVLITDVEDIQNVFSTNPKNLAIDVNVRRRLQSILKQTQLIIVPVLHLRQRISETTDQIF